MPRKPANCYIIAGSNGAGKTTFATKFLPLYANCRNFINPDLLARAYSPFDPDAGMLRAGRTVLERIGEFTEARWRFGRTLRNLFTLYRPLLDTLHFFDNSSGAPRLVFKDEARQTTLNDAALYERLRQEFAP
jgi:predicted ABC-type ATPase